LDWQVTATTLFCDQVGEWVTIMVYPDGTVKCNYFVRHGPTKKKVKGEESKENRECTGTDCALCTGYKEKVSQRDAEAAKSGKA